MNYVSIFHAVQYSKKFNNRSHTDYGDYKPKKESEFRSPQEPYGYEIRHSTD